MTSRQESMSQKRAYVKELLHKNVTMSPKAVRTAVKRKFGSTVSKKEIGVIRREFGVVLGGRGVPMNLKGERLPNKVINPEPVRVAAHEEETPAEPQLPPNDQKLTELVKSLQTQMEAMNISRMEIDGSGTATVHMMVERSLRIH